MRFHLVVDFTRACGLATIAAGTGWRAEGEIIAKNSMSDNEFCGNAAKTGTLSLACGRWQRLSPGLVIVGMAVFRVMESLLRASTRLHTLHLACLSVVGVGGNASELCHGSATSALPNDVGHEIQAVSAPYLASYSALQNASAVITCLLIGAWSDRHGRKPVMLLPLGGMMLACLCFAMSLLPVVSPIPGGAACLLVGAVVYGVSGKSNAFNAGVNSYITDCSTDDVRTRYFARLNGMTALGNCVGFALLTCVTLVLSFEGVLIGVSLLAALLCLVLLLVLKESRPPQDIPPTADDKVVGTPNRHCGGFQDIGLFLTRRRRGNQRARILLLLFSLFLNCGMTVTEVDVGLLYVTRREVGWDDTVHGAYLTTRCAVTAILMLAAYPLAERCCRPSDEACILLGSGMKALALIATGLTTNTALLFILVVASAFDRLTVAAMHSQLTKLVAETEVGANFAIVSCLKAASTVVWNPVFTAIYVSSVSVLPGAAYFAFAVEPAFIIVTTVCLKFAPSCDDEKLDT